MPTKDNRTAVDSGDNGRVRVDRIQRVEANPLIRRCIDFQTTAGGEPVTVRSEIKDERAPAVNTGFDASRDNTLKIGVIEVNENAMAAIRGLCSGMRFQGDEGALEMVKKCNKQVHSRIKYDLSEATQLSLEIVLDKNRGVCTHFATVLHLVLKEFGIPSELITGRTIVIDGEAVGAGSHVWVKVTLNGVEYLVDPTGNIFGEYRTFCVTNKPSPSLVETCYVGKLSANRWTVSSSKNDVVWDWDTDGIGKKLPAVDGLLHAVEMLKLTRSNMLEAAKLWHEASIWKRSIMMARGTLLKCECEYNKACASLEALAKQAMLEA